MLAVYDQAVCVDLRSDDRAARAAPRWRPRPGRRDANTRPGQEPPGGQSCKNRQRFFVGLHDFDAANDDALERIAAGMFQADFVGQPAGGGQQLLAVEIHAGQRPDEVCPARVGAHSLQGRGMRHLLFAEVIARIEPRRWPVRRSCGSCLRTWHTRRDAKGPRSRRAARTAGSRSRRPSASRRRPLADPIRSRAPAPPIPRGAAAGRSRPRPR